MVSGKKGGIIIKIYYFYGTMNSAKSLNLLAKSHQFKEAGSKVLLMKPTLDTRTIGKIKTRIGLEEECVLIHKDEDIEDKVYSMPYVDSIFVDEVQFLTKEQINQLWRIAKNAEVRVFCYGLKTNFKNELFEASAQLLVVADKVEEIVSKCKYCDNKATTHNKISGSKSKSNEVGDIKNSKVIYESVCQECYVGHIEGKFEPIKF